MTPPRVIVPMELTVRAIEETDLTRCAALLRGRSACPGDLLAAYPRIWRQLLDDGALHGVLVERTGESGHAEVLAFGAAVFTGDAWIAAARVSPEPHLTARTLAAEIAGTSPILRPKAVERAGRNGGLNILMLHYCERHDLPPMQYLAIRYRLAQAFVDLFRGYRIKEILHEPWGDDMDPDYIVNGWGRLRNEYASYYRDRGQTLPEPHRRPYLVGLTLAEALATPCDAVLPAMFVFTPARFCLSRAEKRILGQALTGRTDVELARHLDLALATVKSHWRAIYNRVSAVAPGLVFDSAHVPEAGCMARGQEKRRRLLEYLRSHPEELAGCRA